MTKFRYLELNACMCSIMFIFHLIPCTCYFIKDFLIKWCKNGRLRYDKGFVMSMFLFKDKSLSSVWFLYGLIDHWYLKD